MNVEDKIKHMALILLSYEMDEPHNDDEEDPIYPNISWDEFLMMFNNEHSGDCIKLPGTCGKCVTQSILHKAKYIVNKLESLE